MCVFVVWNSFWWERERCGLKGLVDVKLHVGVWCVEQLLLGEREIWGDGTGGCLVTCGCLVCGTDIGRRKRETW
jgi:hypothetical protein